MILLTLVSVYHFDNWLFDPALNTLTSLPENADTITKVIEPQLGQLLCYFLERPGQVISRDELIREAWRGVVSDSAINQAVAKLRKALGDNAASPICIQTVSKQGYRFIAKVTLSETLQNSSELASTKAAIQTLRETNTAPKALRQLGGTLEYLTQKSLGLLLVMTSLLGISLVWYISTSFVGISSPVISTSNSRNITSHAGLERYPSFHPGGDSLVYTRRQKQQNSYDLILADIDGNMIKALTQTPNTSEMRSAWSPDGQWLAYTVFSSQGCHIKLIHKPLSSTPTHKDLSYCSLFDTQLVWHPDGQRLLFNRRAYENGPLRVYAITIHDGRLQELSQANQGITGDIAFALSPDGENLAIMRTQHWNQSSLHLVSMSTLQNQHLTDFDYWVQSIQYDDSGESLLWAAPPFYQNIQSYHLETERLTEVVRKEYRIADPQITPTGQLSYVANSYNADIVWQPLDSRRQISGEPQAVIDSTRQDWHPLMHSNGKHLAFISNRTGEQEIWLRNLSNDMEKQLTQLQGQAVPHRMSWHPDENRIVFDSNDDHLYLLTIADLDKGIIHLNQLTQLEHKARNPRWTKAGLFYSAYNDGEWQVNRLAQPNALPEPATLSTSSNRAFSAEPLRQGNGWLYTKFYLPGFWLEKQQKEQQIAASGVQGPFNQWQQGKAGLYYLHSDKQGPAINYLDWQSRRVTTVVRLRSRDLLGFSVAPDESGIFFTQINQENDDIMLAF